MSREELIKQINTIYDVIDMFNKIDNVITKNYLINLLMTEINKFEVDDSNENEEIPCNDDIEPLN